MGTDRAVQAAVQKLAGTFLKDPSYAIACVVESVDINARTCDCTPIGGDAVTEIPNVQLMAEVDDGILLIPVVGSTVVVCYSVRNVPYIALYSALDKVFLISNNGLQFQGGEFGGLVKVVDLVSRLNKVETDLNTLKAAFNSWVVIPEDGGAALKAASSEWAGENMAETVRSDIENTSITQGE